MLNWTKPTAYRAVLIWGGIASLLILAHLRLFPYAEDDAYIHFRIALNLVDHGVPYFNISDPIYATSSLGWTFLLTLIFRVTREPHVIAILNALLTTAGAFLFKRLLEKTTANSFRPIAYWLFVPFYIAQLAIPSTGLMETPFVLFLLAAGSLLWLDQKPLCFLIFWGMAFTRLEYAIVLILVMGYGSIQKRFSVATILRYSALGATPFILFALYFWGTLIPNTTVAKQKVYALTARQSAVSLANTILPDLAFHRWEFHLPPTDKLIYLLVLATMIILFIVYTHRQKPTHDRTIFYLFLMAGIAVIGAYGWRKLLVFNWYVPLYTVLIGVALYRLVFLTATRARWLLLIAMLPYFFLTAVYFSETISAVATDDPSFYPNFAPGARVRKYIELGRTLKRQYPSATLLSSEIGGLGYGFAGYIFDGAGLISPAAISFHPMKIPEERSSGYLGAIPPEFVRLVNPDIIVSYDIFIEAFLRSDVADHYVRYQEPIFLEEDLQRSPSKNIWGSKILYVFVKKGLISADFPNN